MSFKSVQSKIAAKEGVSQKAAGAILASASRNASPEAKKENPKLNRVNNPNGNPGHHPSTQAFEHNGPTHDSKMR